MRRSGILLHITSLPGEGGIGSLGEEARAFARFLHEGGMSIWQVLPVGPVGYGESPYQCSSVHAGNPLLISVSELRREGILTCEDSEIFSPAELSAVDYPAVRENRELLLRKAFEQSAERMSDELEAFVHSHSWVKDFALFTALKKHFGDVKWTLWPDEALRMRQEPALSAAREQFAEEARYHIFVQMLFYRQWLALKSYCNSLGISLFGDMPIYVAEDSADTWTNPHVFQLDKNRVPKRVAGVPPDYFSEDGQLWGNPLYRWRSLRFLHHYDWWVGRMRTMAELYDMVRIDHFIGFANYWSVPYGAPNARGGKWVVGPGKSLFRTLEKEVPGIVIIAEDLGVISKRVKRLLKAVGYPGMRIMCFGFGDGGGDNTHFPDNYVENCVAYTGTHDNDTVLGWYKSTDPKVQAFAREYVGFEKAEDAPEAFLKVLFASRAGTAIVPMQDVLGLDTDARMNYPGTIGGNWRWRMLPGVLTKELADRLFRLNETTQRLPRADA